MADAPQAPGDSWRSKWRWVAVFWVVQAVVLYVGWAAFIVRESRAWTWSGLVSLLQWDEVQLIGLSLVVAVTLMQGLLLMPIRRPGMGPASLGVRALHCGLSAATIGAIAWLLLWPVAAALEYVNIRLSMSLDGALSLSVPIAAAVVSFCLLWSRRDSGVPVRVSVTIAALGAALLASALLGGIASLIVLVTGKGYDLTFFLMFGGGILAWAVFTPLLLAFCRRRRAESALARIAAKLFLGTIIEAAAIIPLDVMMRRKDSCYCGVGTFWSLTFCWGVGALALGPVVFLMPLCGRRKRWYAGLCDVCDYDMSGCMDAERCPECGAGWREAAKRV